MIWKPANSKGEILQGHSHIEGISWFVDREGPEDPQTSRVKILSAPSDDTADVMANTGVARDTISAQRSKKHIFLIAQM
jgi:hypothetical protein